MEKFCNESINEFLNKLASDMPAPGGGAVAGLVGALCGSLNSMVYSLTVGKKKYEQLGNEEKQIILQFQEKSKEFTKLCLKIMDDDRENFMKLMECFKLPKDSEEEKKTRNKAIKNNTIKAMSAPLELVRESIKFYDNLNIMLKYGNRMLMSDLSISALLLHSAIESSVINVKVNLNSLKNEEFFETIDKEIKEICIESEKKKNAICNEIDKIIYSA